MSRKGKTSNRFSWMAPSESICLFVWLLFFCLVDFFAPCLGGSYVAAIFSRTFLSWPLSSKRSIVNWISFFVCSGVVHKRWARQISASNVAMTVPGCWQDCGLIVTFVLEGLRKMLVLTEYHRHFW